MTHGPSTGHVPRGGRSKENSVEYESTDGRMGALVAGLALGAVIGAGIALLTAPDSGRKTRRRLRKTTGRLTGGAGDRWDDFAEDVKGRVDEAISSAAKRLPGR
jgi:gas vesicle protein